MVRVLTVYAAVGYVMRVGDVVNTSLQICSSYSDCNCTLLLPMAVLLLNCFRLKNSIAWLQKNKLTSKPRRFFS